MGKYHLHDEHGAIVASFDDWDEGLAEGARRMIELRNQGRVGKFELRDPSGKKASHTFVADRSVRM
ncbi:MAG TPA: hypothetical protein VGU20_21140 [Stellaceae bacterium]|nr:hypothetical protein [Stellaceae bacterium]